MGRRGPEAHVGPVAFHARLEMRESHAVCCQHPDQAGAAALELAVAAAVGRAGGEKEERRRLYPGVELLRDAIPDKLADARLGPQLRVAPALLRVKLAGVKGR